MTASLEPALATPQEEPPEATPPAVPIFDLPPPRPFEPDPEDALEEEVRWSVRR